MRQPIIPAMHPLQTRTVTKRHVRIQTILQVFFQPSNRLPPDAHLSSAISLIRSFARRSRSFNLSCISASASLLASAAGGSKHALLVNNSPLTINRKPERFRPPACPRFTYQSELRLLLRVLPSGCQAPTHWPPAAGPNQ
jgi:hypothetical protein